MLTVNQIYTPIFYIPEIGGGFRKEKHRPVKYIGDGEFSELNGKILGCIDYDDLELVHGVRCTCGKQIRCDCGRHD